MSSRSLPESWTLLSVCYHVQLRVGLRLAGFLCQRVVEGAQCSALFSVLNMASSKRIVYNSFHVTHDMFDLMDRGRGRAAGDGSLTPESPRHVSTWCPDGSHILCLHRRNAVWAHCPSRSFPAAQRECHRQHELISVLKPKICITSLKNLFFPSQDERPSSSFQPSLAAT